MRGVVSCVWMDGEMGWEMLRVRWQWAGSLVSFWGLGVFWGAVMALTNADMEHPSQDTLLGCRT